VQSELADLVPCQIRDAADADEHLRSGLTDRTIWQYRITVRIRLCNVCPSGVGICWRTSNNEG